MAPLFTGFHFGFGKGPAGTTGPTAKVTGGSVEDGILDPTGSYRFFVFHGETPSPALTLTVNENITGAELLVVGGGGGGGSGHAGGGGAGAVVYGPNVPIPTGSYTVTIGEGGAYAPGPGSYNISPQAYGGSSTLGSPGEFYALGGGGGRGGGWKDGGDPAQFVNSGGPGNDGGSGGGATGSPSNPTTYYGGEGDVNSNPTEERWGGQANQWAHNGGQCNNGPASRGGTGGGGAACNGQGIELGGPGKNPNPTSHPTTAGSTVGGNKDTSPTNSSPYFMSEPPFSPTGGIWPAISLDNSPGSVGGFGGHGAKLPSFPAPVIGPAFPTSNDPNINAPTDGMKADFEGQVGPEGYFGGGGGGGDHGSTNPGTPRGSGMGGIGGGGEGGTHNPNPTGPGTPGYFGTGSGGGGGGSQGDAGGEGSDGVVIIRIPV